MGSELFVSQVDFHAPVRRVRRALGVVGDAARAGQAHAIQSGPIDAARHESVSDGLGPAQRESDGATLVATEVALADPIRALVVASDAIQPALRIRVTL